MTPHLDAALGELRDRLTELDAERTHIGEAIVAMEKLNGTGPRLLPAGKPAKPSKDKKESAKRLYESDPSLSITAIAERVGVSAATIYAWRTTGGWVRADD